MIREILHLLNNANGETENIRLAQGKKKLPSSIKEVFKKFNRERKWQ